MEFDDKMKQLNDICGKIQDSSCTVADSAWHLRVS